MMPVRKMRPGDLRKLRRGTSMSTPKAPAAARLRSMAKRSSAGARLATITQATAVAARQTPRALPKSKQGWRKMRSRPGMGREEDIAFLLSQNAIDLILLSDADAREHPPLQ